MERPTGIPASLDLPLREQQPRALVVIPGGLNYFYDQTGRRIADALTARGWSVDVRAPGEIAGARSRYDMTLLVNIAEVLVGYAVTDPIARQHGLITAVEETRAIAYLREVRAHTTAMASVQLDAADTPWFERAWALCDEAGVTDFLDLGFHDQSAATPPGHRPRYRFVVNGLTDAERARLDTARAADERPIPWVCVGHQTLDRVRLVKRLMRDLDPRGFVYMPALAPFTQGGPHLDEAQFARVLSRARYQVWQSHHPHFYLESERFRQSVLAGGVPVKVIASAPPPGPLPFRAFLLDADDVATTLRTWDFSTMRERAANELRSLPSLGESLATTLMACFPARHYGR